jgi:hypothetical protein
MMGFKAKAVKEALAFIHLLRLLTEGTKQLNAFLSPNKCRHHKHTVLGNVDPITVLSLMKR